MQVLYAGRIGPTTAWALPRHVHRDHNELIVIARGSMRVDLDDGSLVARAGDVLVYRRDQWHAETAVAGRRFESLFLGWSDDADRSWVADVRSVQRLDARGHIGAAVRWIVDLWQRGAKEDRAHAAPLLAAALHELSATPRTVEDRLVQRVRTFIASHLADPLTLDDLAAEVAMSRYHFARVFAKVAGESPMAYLRARRVEAAKTLLMTSPLPLRAIAPLVGFPDAFHLSRVFTRTLGRPPGSFRKG